MQNGGQGGRCPTNIPAAGGAILPGISEEALKKAEEFIEADEGALNRLSGRAGTVATTVAVVMSLFHLYAAIAGAWPFTISQSSRRSRCATPTSPSCWC